MTFDTSSGTLGDSSSVETVDPGCGPYGVVFESDDYLTISISDLSNNH